MRTKASRRPHSSPARHKTQSAVAQAVSLALMTAGTASAQTLEEIIVTATKRDESVQDVPLAITAFSGDFTRNVNLDDVKDLISFTPGVTGNSKDSFIDAVSIRGVRTQDFGVGGDPSAAFFKNDLYEGRNGVVVTSLYDIDRSEVLRGPQGFLFGRNAVGGAISVHTSKAELGDRTSGYFELDGGERSRSVFEGAINIPIGDNFATRFAGYYFNEDGFVDNSEGGPDLIASEKAAARWSTTYETEKLTVQTMVEYENRGQSGSIYRAQEDERFALIEATVGDITLPTDERNTASEQFFPRDNSEIFTLGLDITYDLGWASFQSTTGYKDHDYFYTEDYDGTNLLLDQYTQDQNGDYFQQEFKLVSQNEGPLSWYAGVSYYREDIDVFFRNAGDEEAFCSYYASYYAYYASYYGFANCQEYVEYYGLTFTPASNGLLDEQSNAIGEYTGWAAYVDVDYEFNDRWDLSVGVRYTYDEKEFSNNVFPVESNIGPFFLFGFTTAGPVFDTQDWDDLTPRAIARFRPNDKATYYASITRGFKSGGFGTFSTINVNDPSTPTGQFFGDSPAPLRQEDGIRPATFDPETVTSYEVGYKGSLFNDRANLNIVGFVYDYNDLQVNFFDQGAQVGNTDEAEGVGIEASVTASIGDYFQLYFAGGFLDTDAFGLDFVCGEPGVCEGRRLWWAPEFSGSVSLTGNFPIDSGELFANFEAFGESSRGGDYDNIPEAIIDPFIEASVRFGYRSENNWYISGYVENITDELTFDGAASNSGIVPVFKFGPSRPRTFGVRFGYEWE